MSIISEVTEESIVLKIDANDANPDYTEYAIKENVSPKAVELLERVKNIETKVYKYKLPGYLRYLITQ